ncbi:helix-turn-helix domain-containing protein [Desulfobacterium sp. N47]|uniref:helix-turn-helix domain-containing protein n=1 Tax=Desulfobacterium sp. N47 TaxID=3115210 RepID=UPI003C952223
MSKQLQMLSVMDIAAICGVARSTVSYWIAKKSLPASRDGKKHVVSINNLIAFLEAEDYPVPKSLTEFPDALYQQDLKLFKACWEYWSESHSENGCKSCSVFTNSLMVCFTARNNPGQKCRMDCSECKYFYDYHAPDMSFIHQISNPAAIYKDLYIWSANRAWADLCGVKTKNLIGAGIEEFIHSESLKNIMNYDKKLRMGNSSEVLRFNLSFISRNGNKIKTDLLASPLKKPDGTWLAVVERQYQL